MLNEVPRPERVFTEMSKTLAIITAAGLSKRAGHVDKLCFHNAQGVPLIYQTYTNLRDAGLPAIQVLLPPEEQLQKKIRACFPQQQEDLSFKIAAKARGGLSQTIQSGAETAIEQNVDNLLIVLGDMPHVPPAHYRQLLAKKIQTQALITATSYNGRYQAPIVWDRKLLPTLLTFETSLQRRMFIRKMEKRFISTVTASPIDIQDYDTYKDLLNF